MDAHEENDNHRSQELPPIVLRRGIKVIKRFDEGHFIGEIVAVLPPEDDDVDRDNWYEVKYRDGDRETLEQPEALRYASAFLARQAHQRSNMAIGRPVPSCYKTDYMLHLEGPPPPTDPVEAAIYHMEPDGTKALYGHAIWNKRRNTWDLLERHGRYMIDNRKDAMARMSAEYKRERKAAWLEGRMPGGRTTDARPCNRCGKAVFGNRVICKKVDGKRCERTKPHSRERARAQQRKNGKPAPPVHSHSGRKRRRNDSSRPQHRAKARKINKVRASRIPPRGPRHHHAKPRKCRDPRLAPRASKRNAQAGRGTGRPATIPVDWSPVSWKPYFHSIPLSPSDARAMAMPWEPTGAAARAHLSEIERARTLKATESSKRAREQRHRQAEYTEKVWDAFDLMAGNGDLHHRPEQAAPGPMTPDVAELLKDNHRSRINTLAPSTWLNHAHYFQKALDWILPRMIQASLEPSVSSMQRNPHFVHAYIQSRVNEGASSAVVQNINAAINKAFSLRSYPPLRRAQAIATARTNAKRFNDKPTAAKEPIKAYQLRAVMNHWGSPDAPLCRQVVALAAALCFDLALRYDDMARISMTDINFGPNGAMICIGLRKSKQHAEAQWLPLIDNGPTGTLALLRRVLDARGFPTPSQGTVTIADPDHPKMVWPILMPTSTGGLGVVETTHPRVGGPVPPPARGQKKPMNGRRQFTDCLRQALTAALGGMGFSKTQVKAFAAHSLRRGANLHRFIKGMPQELRMELAGWKTPSVEASYRICNFARRMQAVNDFQL